MLDSQTPRPALARLAKSAGRLCLLAMLFAPLIRQAKAGPLAKGPNILILVADDMRGGTLGVDGDPRRATPNLDALAGAGVRFARTYCNSPVCTPSRQSFITGRLPHAVGVTRLPTPLPDTAVTLGDWLSNLGYDTAAFGKMHFNAPSHHGFRDRLDIPDWNRWLRLHPPAGGNQRVPWRPFVDPSPIWLNADCRSAGLPVESMESAYFADRAVEYFQAHKDRPFLLVVGFYDPHSPFRFPREWEGRYPPSNFHAPTVNQADLHERPNVFKPLNDRHAQGIQAAYYTSISFLDHEIGRVLKGLKESGLEDDTIVVFLGDNGYMLGEHARFEKHVLYENAVRVPFLVRWPKVVPAGKRVDEKVELVDLFPTVLELAGVVGPSDLHGQSLVPLLKGVPGARGRDIVFSEYLENEEAMARSDRYKYIAGNGRRKPIDGYENDLPLTGPYERLFDMEADPGETTDLSQRPELARVKAELRHWLYQRLVSTRDGAEPVPKGLGESEAIRWCLIPKEPDPRPPGR
ncbi:MAG: sulfatase-like hydrolase/transferase [Isosphaeraceae bacterium]